MPTAYLHMEPVLSIEAEIHTPIHTIHTYLHMEPVLSVVAESVVPL